MSIIKHDITYRIEILILSLFYKFADLPDINYCLLGLEYADCIPCKAVKTTTTPQKIKIKGCPGYDIKLYLLITLQIWGVWSISSLLLLPGPLSPGMVVLSMNMKYSNLKRMIFKRIYLTHRYYHSGSEWNWKYWAWRGTSHSSDLQKWSRTTRYSLARTRILIFQF